MMMMTMVAQQLPNVSRESIRKGLDDIRSFDGIFGKIKYDPVTASGIQAAAGRDREGTHPDHQLTSPRR
jgi:hypothetical protein